MTDIKKIAGLACCMVFVSTSFAGATFHPGDRGSQVLAVQQQLAADGYSLTVDGDYGTGTTEAIRAFQQDHGLTADGILGAATYEALMGVSMPDNTSSRFVQKDAAAPETASAQPSQLQDIQQALADRGYSVDVDGVFGKGTDAAVRSFQNSNGLTADGVIGPATYEALMGRPMPAGQTVFSIADQFRTDAAPAAPADKGTPAVSSEPATASNAIILLQQALVNNGYSVDVDGVFGVGTENAVRNFQASHGLEVDGVAGQATFYELTGKFLPSGPLRRFGNGGYGGATMVADRAQRLMGIANQYIGVPYVFGGNDPSGFDCSGFTRYVYSAVGIDLPRMADEQYNVGYDVSRSYLKPGDLVFFTTYLPGVSHVGIYIGDNQFINASNSGVSIDSLDSRYWSSRYIGAKRVM